MKGRWLAWPLLAVAALALAAQTARWRGRLLASELVRQVEAVTLGAAGSLALERLLPYDLEALRRAAGGDPSLVEVPLARGSVYLLLQRPRDAAHEYRAAIALEPHPEIYLHLGDAILAQGRLNAARPQYRIAVRLDPWLAASVPSGVLEPPPQPSP